MCDYQSLLLCVCLRSVLTHQYVYVRQGMSTLSRAQAAGFGVMHRITLQGSEVLLGSNMLRECI